MKIRIIVLFIVGSILLGTLIIYLITHCSWLFSLTSESGVIGDAINGITAPFIGILGVILIYISFNEQVIANKILGDYNKIKLNLELIYELKRDALILHDRDRWKVTTLETPFLKGLREDKSNVPSTFKRQLIYILNNFIYVRQRIDSFKLLDDDENNALKNLLNKLYESYLQVYCKEYSEIQIPNEKRAPLNTALKTLSMQMIELNKELLWLEDSGDDT